MVQVVVRVEEQTLNPEALRKEIDSEGCGSIVSFVGLTRGMDNGVEVEKLEFDAWEEMLPSVLQRLGLEAVEKFSVQSVVIAHRTGDVLPQEPIVCIHVSSPHRAEGFKACSRIIDELKIQAPLWKKEVRSDGEFWKSGLG